MEPKDFARLLLRRKSTVIMATIIVVVTVVMGSLRRAPVFVAQCEVLFQGIGFELSEADAQNLEPFGSLETNMDILAGPAVAQVAANRLGVPITEVQGKVNVSLKPGTQIFLLQVADTPAKAAVQTGERAGVICNGYAEAYLEYRRGEGLKRYEHELRRIENDQINTQTDLDVARKDYQAATRTGDDALTVEKLNTFNNLVFLKGELDRRHTAIASKIKLGLDGEGGQISRYAGPGVAANADLQRTLLLGLIVGFLFGIGIALIREYLDDTLKDKEGIQRELGVPVLANLPASSDVDGLDGPPAATIEAARTLRATLASLGFPDEKRMLMIASSLSKRRSTTLAALAAAVAESGRSVLVVGSDLRSGRTHESFGIANTVGLANVVRGQVSLQKAVRPAPGMDGVWVLPCGPIIGSPGEILSSESMAFVLREAREFADVVLLDAPPILAAADASILGAYADGVILVASSGRTNRAKAHEAKEQLVAAGARVLGAVLIGGDDERDRDGLDVDDLGGGMPMGGGYGQPGAYSDAMAGYGNESFSMTARMAPRAPSERRAPAKKVSAASYDDRPRRYAEPATPRSVRTTRPASRPMYRDEEPARPSRSTSGRPAVRKPAAPRTATRSTAARKPAAPRTATRSTAARKPAAPRTATRSTAARKPASSPTARRATTKRTPAKHASATRTAGKRPTRR